MPGVSPFFIGRCYGPFSCKARAASVGGVGEVMGMTILNASKRAGVVRSQISPLCTRVRGAEPLLPGTRHKKPLQQPGRWSDQDVGQNLALLA